MTRFINVQNSKAEVFYISANVRRNRGPATASFHHAVNFTAGLMRPPFCGWPNNVALIRQMADLGLVPFFD